MSRAYVVLDSYPADGLILPTGTRAYTEPAAALSAAQEAGAAVILLFWTNRPLCDRQGRTVEPLQTSRPRKVYHTAAATVASCGSHEPHPDKLRSTYAPARLFHAGIV